MPQAALSAAVQNGWAAAQLPTALADAAPAGTDAAQNAAAAPGLPARLPAVLALVWLAGVAAVLVWQGAAYLVWRRRALRHSTPPDPAWQQALQTAQQAVPLPCPPDLVASAAVRSPVAAGILRPLLFVPAGGAAPAGAALMLTHELTHIRRHDIAFKLLLIVACALHWYDPAVWLLARRAGRDIEAACDAQVLAGCGAEQRTAYGKALLAAARMGRAPALTSGFALTRKDWDARLQGLWDLTPKRRGRAALAALALAGALTAGLAACQAQPGQTGELLAAPEYPWTESYDQIKAALDDQRITYHDDGASLRFSGGELFGQPMQEVDLSFNTQGQLYSVRGSFPLEEQDAVQAALADRLGEPLPEFTYITTFNALSASAEYRAHREDMTGSFAAVWAGSRTLGEEMGAQQRQTFRDLIRENYAASEEALAGRTETIETADGTETIWYGEAAVDAILSNPATLVRCFRVDEQVWLTVENTAASLDLPRS